MLLLSYPLISFDISKCDFIEVVVRLYDAEPIDLKLWIVNIEDFLKSKDMNTFASFRMLWIKVVHCQLPIIVKCNEIQLNYSANKTKIVILLYRITKQNKQTHRATWKTKESRQISHKPATDKAFTKSWGKVKHSFAKINDTKQQKWH